LDEFYGRGMKPGFLGHVLPHEKDIAAFLFEDCTPQPPCACSSLRFNKADDVAAAVACCRDLKAACKAPFAALSCKTVEAYCRDDQQQAAVAHWVGHALRGADCMAYHGAAFNYMPLAVSVEQGLWVRVEGRGVRLVAAECCVGEEAGGGGD
jgi:hypothetical protein